jgi:hypothetical protein
MITTQQTKPVPDPKTPARLEGKTAPPLEDTAVPGVKHARVDVPDVYYHESSEKWFRWAMDRWFVAFLWNGQWFPLDKGELPAEMAALQPSIEEKKERRLTRAEELKKIDEELRQLEGESQTAPDGSGAAPKDRADELRELDRQLEELEKQEQQEKREPQEQAPENTPPAKPSQK